MKPASGENDQHIIDKNKLLHLPLKITKNLN